MDGIICENCQESFDESNHLPMNLPCSHPMCLNCINNFHQGDKVSCPLCDFDLSKVNLKDLKPHQIILSIMQGPLNQTPQDNSLNSEEQSNTSEKNEDPSSSSSSKGNANENLTQTPNQQPNEQIEYCLKHKEKQIEFFCQSCTTAVCSLCIFETHNGHHLTLLEDMSTIIKNNVKDFWKILKNLEKVNEDNKNNAESKIEEVDKLKQNQINMVTKSFDEIIKKIEEKKNSILDEFNTKYSHEVKRFQKLQTCLKSNLGQISKIAEINKALTENFEKFSDARILKKISDFTSFLHRSAADIKKLYKIEISLKAELSIDPAMKPLPINISGLMKLLEKIDPKTICYPLLDESLLEETDISNNIRPTQKQSKVDVEKGNNFDNEINNFFNRVEDENKSKKSELEIRDHYEYASEGNIMSKNMRQKRNKNIQGNLNTNQSVNSYNNKSINEEILNTRYRNKNLKYRNKSAQQRVFNDSSSSSDICVGKIKNYVKTANNHVNNLFPFNSNGEVSEDNNVNNANRQNLPKHQIPSMCIGKRKIKTVNLPYIGNINVKNEYNSDNAAIYCFGEGDYCLKFILTGEKWALIRYNSEQSKLLGSVRYASACTIPGNKIMFTGGCKKINDEPTNIVIQLSTYNVNNVTILKPMNIKRYGHSSVFLNHSLYIIGGYEHADRERSSILSTLKSCEKYELNKGRWESIASLNHPRAFCGSLIYNKNIFVFGGLYNNQLLSSIEKYDTYTNIWITYHVKLHEKLAKMGVVNYNDETVILLGGINEDFEIINTVIQGKLNGKTANKWFKAPEMLCPRDVSCSSFYLEGCIYVLGGSHEGICEKFDFATKKWEMIESYYGVINSNKVDNVLSSFCCALSYYQP